MANHDVISAFIDNEPFDPAALSEALADPDGRELLLDLLTLRKLTLLDDVKAAAGRLPVSPLRRVTYLTAAAAVVVLAIAGGYELGERSAAQATAPPAPTVVVTPDTGWQDVTLGGSR